MKDRSKQWLMWVSEIQAIAQSGLAYCTKQFDIGRFRRLLEISAELTAALTDLPMSEIHQLFTLQKGYATPKIDIRSFVLKDGQILLVRERADNLWTLPGGFADVNEPPSVAVIRETKEESGYDVIPTRLLAFWDVLKHDHPLQWPHLYKSVFLCELTGGKPEANIEISEVGFFSIDKLPSLSTPRITHKQLVQLYELAQNSNPTVFD